jgi:hypothetical protein
MLQVRPARGGFTYLVHQFRRSNLCGFDLFVNNLLFILNRNDKLITVCSFHFSHRHHPPCFKCHIPAPPDDAIITAMGQAGVMCQFVDQIYLPALGRKDYLTSSLLPEAIPDFGLIKTEDAHPGIVTPHKNHLRKTVYGSIIRQAHFSRQRRDQCEAWC